jgi:hypothetical protein
VKSARPLPRVRLDLARISADGLMLPGSTKPTEADTRAMLGQLGWVESADGWWTAPSERELRMTIYAATERESTGRQQVEKSSGNG